MSTSPASPQTPKRGMLWTGRVLSGLAGVYLILTGCFALSHAPAVLEGMKKFGYQESAITVVAILEIGSAVLYLIPQTSMLGAILVTAYLGGAVATHVRVGDPGWPMAVIVAFIFWIGLYLRDERLRALVPIRRAR